jgi:hypothetical protein
MRKDFNITDPGTFFPPTAKIILIPRDINEKLEQVMGRKIMFPITQRFVIKAKQRGNQSHLCNRLLL